MASAMVVVSTLPAAVFGQTSYPAELEGAYAYAYDLGITTQASMDSARLYDSMTRAELAKMISNFAMQVAGLTPDTEAACSFSDLAPVAGTDLADFAVTACQLGLMGIGTNGIFNPNGQVTRAEFGTVLSRVLYGDTYNGGNPYYEAHLNALKAAGIMNDISNPDMKEIRGYVMLMMQRSDANGSTTPALCNTPEVIFACMLDIDCPAECAGGSEGEEGGEETEVLAGGLNLSLNSATLANNSQIPMVGTVKFAAVNFSASSSDVNVKSVAIEKLGLATIPSATRVWFERNGVRITGRAAFTSEGKAILSFAPAFKVKANSTEVIDLYVELSTVAGVDFQFKSAMVDSTAEAVNGGFTTPVLQTVNYTVSDATFNDTSVGGTSSVTSNGMELGSFSVQVNNPSSETRDAMFKSITLRQNDNADLSNLGAIILERNGEIVSTDYVINGRDITFSVNDEIKDATTATYYIKAVVNNVDQSTDDYTFELRNDSDLNIVEKNTSFRLTVTGAQALGTYSIQGGDITFARDTSVALASNYAGGTPNVILMKGTMSANNAITVEDPSIDYLLGLDDDDMYDQFSTIYLSIGGSTFSYSPVNGGAATSADFLGTATINGTVQVKVRGTLKDTAPATQIKLGSLQLSSFALAEYVSNGNTVASAIGSIEGVNVTVEDSTLNVTKTDGLGDQTIAAGLNGFTVIKLNLSSNQGNGVRVSRAVFDDGVSAALALNNTTLTLYVDGSAVSTKQLQGSTVTFDFPSFTVSQGSPKTLEVKANFAEAFNAGDFQLVLSSLQATDVLTSQTVTYQTPSSAVFTIGSADAQVTASNDPVLASLVLSPSADQKLFAFRVKALNDGVRLRDVSFTGIDLDNLNNFRLSTDGTVANVFATATTASATAVTFTNISQANAPLIAKDATATYYVLADVNSQTNGVDVDLSLTALSVRATNGSTVTPTFTAIASNTHTIAENSLVVAKAANGSKNLSTSALRFTVAAAGKDSVTLDAIEFDTILAGYTGSATIEVYKNSVSAANLVDSASINIGNDSASLTSLANNIVDAGQTVTYIVVVTGLAVDPSSNSQDWSITLTDLGFDGLSAVAYDNVGGNLPVTESK